MYPDGLQSSFNYDTLNRLTATTSHGSSYTYQLGPTGIWKGVTELSGRTLTWNYDGIYRMTNEVVAGDPNSTNGTVGIPLILNAIGHGRRRMA